MISCVPPSYVKPTSAEYTYNGLGELLEARDAAEMKYRSDYLGRMQCDGEKVIYGYNYGGEVESVTGEKQGKSFTYVEKVGYDAWGAAGIPEKRNPTTCVSHSGQVVGLLFFIALAFSQSGKIP